MDKSLTKRKRQRKHRGKRSLLSSVARLPSWGQELIAELKKSSISVAKNNLEHLDTIRRVLTDHIKQNGGTINDTYESESDSMEASVSPSKSATNRKSRGEMASSASKTPRTR